MADYTLEISSIFKEGLRSEDRDNRGLLKAKEFRGLQAGEFGARDTDSINNIVSLNTMYIADRLAFHKTPENLTYPYPEIFIGKTKSLILGPTTVTEFNHVAGTMPARITPWRNTGDIESNTGGGNTHELGSGYTHIADFGDTYYLFSDDLVLIRSPFLSAADDGTAAYMYDANITVRTGCAFRGQLITGGFDKADYHNAAWIALWDAWTALANAKGIATTAAKGPDKNWVRWGTIGGGDFILHWFPTTFARFGGRTQALGWQESTSKGEFIANGDASKGLVNWYPYPRTTFQETGNTTWAVETKTAKVAFIRNMTLSLAYGFPLHQDTHQEFKSGLSYEVSIDFIANPFGDYLMQVYLGPDINNTVAVSSSLSVSGNDTWETKTFTLVPSADTRGIGIHISGSAASSYVGFTDLSVTEDPGTGTLDGFDSDQPYFWEFLRRGDIGFMPMPSQGAVLNTSPLKDHVIVLSEDSVNAITPRVADGLPTYGLEENLHHTGILSRSALASDGKDSLIFVDETGELQRIDNNLKVERLGFREYFSGKTDLVGGYDPVKKAFYIGDKDETFRLDRDGKLTQVRENRVTVTFSSNGALSGMADTANTSLGSITWDNAGAWTSETFGATVEDYSQLLAGSDVLSSNETFTTVVGKKYFIRVAFQAAPTGSIKLTFAGVTTDSFNTIGIHEFIITATSTSSKLVVTPQSSANYQISEHMLLVASYDQLDFSIESDYYDLNHAGTKVLEWLEMDYKDITSLEITITYYVDQDDSSPMTIGPLVGNNGQYYVGIAFTHFKIKVEGIRGTDPSITSLVAKYSFSDDRAQRHDRQISGNQMEPVA